MFTGYCWRNTPKPASCDTNLCYTSCVQLLWFPENITKHTDSCTIPAKHYRRPGCRGYTVLFRCFITMFRVSFNSSFSKWYKMYKILNTDDYFCKTYSAISVRHSQFDHWFCSHNITSPYCSWFVFHRCALFVKFSQLEHKLKFPNMLTIIDIYKNW